MIILSKYSVLSYLTWIKNNKFCEEKHPCFLNLLKTKLRNTKVFDISTDSRNLVFEFQLNDGKSFILKQFGPSLKEKETFFYTEANILNQNFDFTSKLVFQDNLNRVIIQEKLEGYNNILSHLSNYDINDNSNGVNTFLEKLALLLKEVHSKTISPKTTSYSHKLDYNLFINMPQLFPIYTLYLQSFQKNCLVHNDINSNNILVNANDIKFIDWEIGEMGDPYYDLCLIIRILFSSFLDGFFLTANLLDRSTKAKELVHFFLNKYDSKLDMKKLKLFFIIYNYENFNETNYLNNIDFFFPEPIF